MDIALEVTGLTKCYQGRPVVDGLDLRLEAGRIHAFVGPNGAGKTTTIRMLLGLIRPTAGEGTVFGVPLAEPSRYLPQVGAMIDGPAFHGALDGRRNLQMLAAAGEIDQSRIPTVLAAVGLTDRAGDQVRTYSLGMRQRLGIAAAMLPEPALLILDEPSNGLDPAGIRDMRSLLRHVADAGVTALVSSHLLAEVETIADSVILIDHGRLRFSGPMDELLGVGGPTHVMLRPEHRRDLERLERLCDRFLAHPSIESGAVRVDGDIDVAALNRAAMRLDLTLVEIVPQTTSLEDVFFAVTDPGDSAAA